MWNFRYIDFTTNVSRIKLINFIVIKEVNFKLNLYFYLD